MLIFEIMKKLLTKITLLISLVLGIQGCDFLKNIDPKPKTELEKLPPLTQTGKNTFGYLVNGKAIVVTNTLKITAIYQQGNLQLGGV